MDIARPDRLRAKRIRRVLYGFLAVVVVGGVSMAVSRLEPAAPSVEAATVYTDTVQRGEMVRQVRGIGRLAPEEIRWIPATTSGIVERILVQPGVEVTPDTVIVELSSLELEQQTRDAELQVAAAEAGLENLRVQLASTRIDREVTAAQVEADYRRAQLRFEAESELAASELLSSLDLELSRMAADQARDRYDMEQERLAMVDAAQEAQLAAEQVRLDQLRILYDLRRGQLSRLQVRAGVSGVLQQVPVEVGAQLGPGTNIARVADPERLMAELEIAETQARDVQVGQYVSIDTRNGIIPGTVTRVDPAVLEGTVRVDVRLDGALPRGARPDLSVDGTIEIERLENVIYVGRPAYGQADSTVGMFRMTADGHAERTRVRLGRASVSTIEVVEGLDVGDEVILSDMSQWDEFDRVRLN